MAAHFDDWAARYDAEIRTQVPRYDEIQDTVAAVEVAWKYEDVGVLVAWKADR